MVDVCLANVWRGADFASHPSGGHRISYLSGAAWQQMLAVGNSSRRGWVEETLVNPHYSWRLPEDMPRVEGKPPAKCPPSELKSQVNTKVWNVRRRLEAHSFTDCADERIRGTFVYGAKEGIAFRGRNNVRVVIHGSDTVARGVELDQAAGGRVDAALVQVTPYETSSGVESAGFHFAPGDKGMAVFRASQLWMKKPSIIAEGEGMGVFDMANSRAGQVMARRGRLWLKDFRISSEVAKSTGAYVRTKRYGEFPVSSEQTKRKENE